MTIPTEVPPLCARLRGLVIFGWSIAAIRLMLDAWVPDNPAHYSVGVFYLIPLALAYIGLTRRWGPIPWKSLALTMLMLGLLVWAVPNTIAYTTGQFMEWDHGRFAPGTEVTGPDGETVLQGQKAAPLQPTAMGKIGSGMFMGMLGGVVGTVFCTVLGTLLIWLPGRSARS